MEKKSGLVWKQHIIPPAAKVIISSLNTVKPAAIDVNIWQTLPKKLKQKRYFKQTKKHIKEPKKTRATEYVK